MLRACVTSDARHPRVCLRKIKTHDQKWPVCLLVSLLAWFWPFRPGYGLSGLRLAFLTLYITLLFALKMSFVFSHRTVNMVYKRVCRNCPISSCGAKYLVRLANHLADVHQLDHIQRRQYLQEAKLQPKVKVVVYESEADNSGKNHYRSLVQTQETVYELSRSQRNEAKRPTATEQDKAQETKKVELLAQSPQ